MENRHKGVDIPGSLLEAETKTGRAIFTGSVTTAAAFFSLTLADFRGFSQFGFLAGTGVVFCVIASFVVHPAMLVISERIWPIVRKNATNHDVKPIGIPKPGWVVLLTALIMLFGGYTIYRSFQCHTDNPWYSDTRRCAPEPGDCCVPPIDFEYNFAKLRTRNNPVLNMSKKYGKAMPLSLQPVMVIAEDLAETKQVHDHVMEMRDTTPRTTLKIIRSLFTFLPDDLSRKRMIIGEIEKLLTDENLDMIGDEQNRADAEQLRTMTRTPPPALFELPEKVIRTFSIVRAGKEELIPFLKDTMKGWKGTSLDDRFVSELTRRWPQVSAEAKERVAKWVANVEIPDTPKSDDPVLAKLIRWTQHRVGILNMIYTNVDTWNGIASIRFTEEASKLEIGGKTFYPAGEAFVFADTMWAMEEDGKIAIGASILVVFLLLLIDFRSLRHTLFVMTPLLGGVLMLCGVMAYDGIKLSFFNMVVLPSLIGIGVDNGVHIYHRYLEEGPGSVPKVLATSGWAVTLASLTTMIGFAGMNLANHAGLNSIGLLAVVGIGCCLVSSVLSFPALLIFMDARRSRKDG